MNLFFELSNEDRLEILGQLKTNAMNLTSLSRRLNLSLQETSRHIYRLHKIGLIQKDRDRFHITSYGESVLKHLKALQFLSRHKNYFNSHSLAVLPEEFVRRIGDLVDCRYEDNSVLLWNNVQRILEEAENHVWTLTGQYDVASARMIPRALSRGVTMMNIDRVDGYTDLSHLVAIPREDLQVVFDARKTGQLKEKMLERVDMFLWISDKEALLAFPSNDGKFDYQGFICKDKNALTWCRKLFQHYWERAQTLEIVIDELYRWITKKTEAISVLRKVATGTKIIQGKELISELRQKGLMSDKVLTPIGLQVYRMLQR